MKNAINVNNPSVIKFLSEITTNIMSNISVDQFFTISQENKLSVYCLVLKIIKNATESRVKLTDVEFRAFLTALWKKNEESENYEIAAILFGITSNYDSINELIKQPVKRVRKEAVKKDKTANGQEM